MKPIDRIKWRLSQCELLLTVKGVEYQRNNDFFHNFTQAAKLNNTTKTDALHGFLTKHLISYFDILQDIRDGKKIEESLIKEKFGDIIVYFLIQEALIIDENSKPPF